MSSLIFRYRFRLLGHKKMNVQTLAGALIASWEGLRLGAYEDQAGVWTIGFGHTAGVKQGDTCTREQAAAWLASDAAPLFAQVKDEPMVAAAAYVSLGFNTGYTSLVHVLAGKAKLSDFVHIHGVVNDGLVRRRAAEQALIDSVGPISA
jgi:lysozyme